MRKLPDVELPANLPECKCFQTSKEITWKRCSDIANINGMLCGAFHQLAEQEQVCPTALMFALEASLVTLLAYIASQRNPALEFGAEQIERASVELVTGIEARLLARINNSYTMARKLGLNEENVRAMYEADGQTRQ